MQVTSYKLQSINCELQITNYKLQDTNYKLQVTSNKLQITGYKLKVARVFKYREAAQPHFGEAEIR